MNGEEPRWNERINSLTTSETVQNDRLDELEDELHAIHQMLEGKASDKDDNGIKGDIVDLARGLNQLRAIMAPDSLGSGGLINRIKALEKDDARGAKSIEYRWKYWTAVTVAVISMVGFLVREWPDIRNAFYGPRTDTVGKEIEAVKHPKSHHKHVVVHEEPDELRDTESENKE